MQRIPCMVFRGGTSKGPMFLKQDLPADTEACNQLLLQIMGSPQPRQIDGIGGGDSLSSKVAIVSLSKRDDADLDYLFCQVHVSEAIVETALNCGNILSAVVPFALERGIIKSSNPETCVRVFNENTGVLIDVTVQTPGGHVTYQGDTSISGVPGTSAPIRLSFLQSVGAKTGKLLPTGKVIDDIHGIPVSCVDVAVPMVIVHAHDVGKRGDETKEELDTDCDFMQKFERLREEAAELMGIKHAASSVCPKICMVSPPHHGGDISSRYFTPFDCHGAHAVSGALCLSAACLIEGSVANQVTGFSLPASDAFEKEIIIEHPSGKVETNMTVQCSESGLDFPTASFTRTARPLFDGDVLVLD